MKQNSEITSKNAAEMHLHLKIVNMIKMIADVNGGIHYEGKRKKTVVSQ